jgi:hypothetical protein
MFTRFRTVLSEMFRKYRPPAEPLDDPRAGVRVPRPVGSGGRSSAIAVPEPEPDQFVDAVARRERSLQSSLHSR